MHEHGRFLTRAYISHAGVRFGLSTLAAAGIGNLISDVVGISLGEAIEAGMSRVLTAPKLSPEQLDLRRTRLVKYGANALGISVGCVIGMFPLLFMHDRKSVFFDDDEMALFQLQFAPYGVTPQQFFELLKHGKWSVAEAGQIIVRKGEPMDSTIFLHSGAAQATSGYIVGAGKDGDDGEICSLYEGRVRPEGFAPELSHLTRGCIIGGSALVEPELTGRPYPNTVILTRKAKYLEWQTESLRAAMKEDKSVEAAVLSTLYLDLVSREVRDTFLRHVCGGSRYDEEQEGTWPRPDEVEEALPSPWEPYEEPPSDGEGWLQALGALFAFLTWPSL